MQPPISKTEGGLPNVRIIGFTGHRHLQNPSPVATALRSELAALQKEGGEFIAISSIAIGADTVFAQEVIRAGIKWVVVLPMPRELFRNDFTPEQWAIAERLISQAVEVRALRGTERPQAYVDGGKATVDESDHLLAVWDGMVARGPGGTADVVAYARMLGRKITLFREGPGGVEKIDPANLPSAESRPEDILATMGPRSELPPPPQRLLDHFKACDMVATETFFRRDTLRIAICHLGATIVAGLSLCMHAHQFAFPTVYLSWLKFIFVSLALGILILLRFTHKHEIWIHKRLMAEYCRSILATWHCREPIEPVSFYEVPELRELAQSALFLRLEENPREAVDLNAFRANYAHGRVMEQLCYFRGEADKAQAKSGPLRTRYWIYTVAAVVFSALVLGLQLVFHAFARDNFAAFPRWEQALLVLLDVLPLVLPALASFTITRLAIEDVDRRIGRFRDLENKMRITLVELSYCGSWESLCRAVTRTERILFNEILEWYSISRYSGTH
jgi:hypothetical protein